VGESGVRSRPDRIWVTPADMGPGTTSMCHRLGRRPVSDCTNLVSAVVTLVGSVMNLLRSRFNLVHKPQRHAEAQLERELTGPLLKRVLVTIIVTGLALGLTSTATNFRTALFLSVGNTVIAAAMLSAARHGHTRLASVVMVLALVVTTIYGMTTGLGLMDDTLLMFPGMFLMASLLLSTNWLIVVMSIATLAVVATGIAQMHGQVATRVPIRIYYHDVVEIVILLGALATFVHHLVGLLRRLIVEARVAHESVRDILDATSEAIFIHDARDGKVLEVNEPTLEMFGVSREDLVGKTPARFSNFAPEHDGKMAAEYIRRAVEEGPQAFEWLACRGDGSTFWVEIALRSARIADKSRVVAVVRDISERRQLEYRMREAETLRAVGQLAGGVAHDFNNQLVGILGHAEFLQEALGRNPELRECADAILVSGRRATELTRQLLAFARRGMRCNLPVDMHQLVVEVIALGRHSIDKRISIE
jgi:PAS domain S-box-containing protein